MCRTLCKEFDTQKSEVGQVIDAQKISDLPIPGRDFIDFVSKSGRGSPLSCSFGQPYSGAFPAWFPLPLEASLHWTEAVSTNLIGGLEYASFRSDGCSSQCWPEKVGVDTLNSSDRRTRIINYMVLLRSWDFRVCGKIGPSHRASTSSQRRPTSRRSQEDNECDKEF
jgi:hypothetical protein